MKPGRLVWAFCLVPLASGPGAHAQQDHESLLSAAQKTVIARRASGLRAPAERRIAEGWSDAKKVAEFLCRPAALAVFRNRIRDADRVFLGLGQESDLELQSSQLLIGRGEVRTASGWREFTFRCRLNPASGRVRAFEPVLSPRTSG